MKELNSTKEQDTKLRTNSTSRDPVGSINPPLGRLYNVEGRHLALHRSGSGEPAVVFLPRAGMIGLDFLNIHDQVLQFTTSVLYDCAGTDWSDQVTLPRSATEVTDELRSLLHEAGVPTPYLLVGHSLGRSYARRYAQRFPGEVAGLLLLESNHEDFEVYMPRQTLIDQLEGLFATLRLDEQAFIGVTFDNTALDGASFQGATFKNVSFRSASLWSNPMKSIHFDGAMIDKVTYAALNDLSKVTVLS